jgi:hypothetical protein
MQALAETNEHVCVIESLEEDALFSGLLFSEPETGKSPDSG